MTRLALLALAIAGTLILAAFGRHEIAEDFADWGHSA